MPEDLLTMSAKEVDRAGVVRRALERRLSQTKAAELLGVSARQVRRMCRAYERQGAGGLISGKRGKPSNNQSLRRVRDREFSRQLGLPPYAFLTRARIARACILLRHGVAASEVASRVGFCDQSQMHRHFVRVVGCTPGTYAGERGRRSGVRAAW